MVSSAANSSDNRKSGLYTRLLRLVLPLAITVALVWYMFTKIDFAQLWGTIRHGVDYKWIVLAMILSIFSHIFRAMRWRLQLRALDINPPLKALSCAIFGTYALNLVFPRLGEVWRCSYISRRQHAPFAKVFGSMVADRLTDTVTVFLLLLTALWVAHSHIINFLDRYPIGENLLNLISTPLFWIVIAAGAVVIVTTIYVLRRTGPVRTLRRMAADLWHGFAAIGRMKGRGAFIFYTLLVWGCYFFQLYLAFFAFSCTRTLIYEPGTAFGLTPCLMAFVLSSIGMAVPSNGGLGPWNVCIIFALGLYGVAAEPATAMSIVVWSAETITLVLLGMYTALYTSRKSPEPLNTK